MIIAPVFFYLLGLMAALVAMRLLLTFRAADLHPSPAKRGLAAGVLVVPILLALLSRPVANVQPQMDASLPAVAAVVGDTGSGLKQDADWAAIAHAFMGGAPPNASSASSTAAPSEAIAHPPASIAELQAAAQREPKNAEAWLALAQTHRLARNFPEAARAYEVALKLDARNADAWADYADALASANGRSLAGKPATAVNAALNINPKHLKGLWLAASLDLEQHDYTAALARWQKLRAALPEGSPDVSIIDANINEARTLAGSSAPTR
jgi:tetratricopeptide (TPR) repeat protein